MKNGLLNGFSFGSQVKIAHSLPGRLRLSVPVLTRLGNGNGVYIHLVEDLLRELPGMRRASINQMTASLLLQYEADQVSESDLLAWLQRLIKTGIAKLMSKPSDADLQAQLLDVQTALQQEIESIRTDRDIS